MMSVDTLEFRKTLRQWACGVTVVTTAKDDQRAGMTVSSFTSVALEPPLILVCLNKTTSTAQLVEEAGVFGVSFLSETQVEVSNRFAGYTQLPEGEDRFDTVAIHTGDTGVPLLSEAVAWLECRVYAIHDGGTHHIIIGEVLAAERREDVMPLIYQNQAYRTVSEPLAENPALKRPTAP